MEFVGSDAAARLKFTALVNPDLGEADYHAAKQTQRKGRPRVADPTVVFAQGHVQSVMQAALDDPVATLEFEKACGVPFLEGEAADEINDFGGLLTLAPNPPPQPCDSLDSRKAHFLRGDLLAIQHADFMPSSVVLPSQDVGARGRSRGKNAVRSTASRAW